VTPPPPKCAQSLHLFDLGLDLGFGAFGKVLILLGFDSGDVVKSSFQISKAPRGIYPRGFLFLFSILFFVSFFLPVLSIAD
jgi:hypothetical protein